MQMGLMAILMKDLLDISGGDWAMVVYVPQLPPLAQQIVQTDYHTFPKPMLNSMISKSTI